MISLTVLMVWMKHRTAEYQITNYEGWNRFAKSIFKQTEYIHSTFDVERSMFGVH